MKRVFVALFIFVVAMFSSTTRSFSQGSVGDFLKGGLSDAELLAREYLRPVGHGLGASLNSGWFNTGRVHRTLGFNVTVTASGTLIQDSDRMFDLSKLAFENLQLRNPGQPIAPTIAGQQDIRPVLHFSTAFPPTNNQVTILEFASPDGFNLPIVPTPMVRIGVGIPGGMEVFGRFVPQVEFDGHVASLWGAGLKLDLKQFLPIARNVPFVNISVLGAYSSLNANFDLDIQRNIYPTTVSGVPVTGGRLNYDNQFFELKSSGYTFNLIASVDIPFVSAFASLGYASSNTSFHLLGDYPILSVTPPTATIIDVTNPLALQYDNPGEMQMIVGATLKLALLHIHASYTLARNPIASVGIGISFR